MLHRPGFRNYLRARGEYKCAKSPQTMLSELPPRTRRILDHSLAVVAYRGTTSAHAENTLAPRRLESAIRNYLRARGEYRIRDSMVLGAWELPPRTRRIPAGVPDAPTLDGTTSAHAENTHRPWYHENIVNYLRARGEYAKASRHHGASSELPPRTRRIPPKSSIICFLVGTTSAHAENT